MGEVTDKRGTDRGLEEERAWRCDPTGRGRAEGPPTPAAARVASGTSDCEPLKSHPAGARRCAYDKRTAAVDGEPANSTPHTKRSEEEAAQEQSVTHHGDRGAATTRSPTKPRRDPLSSPRQTRASQLRLHRQPVRPAPSPARAPALTPSPGAEPPPSPVPGALPATGRRWPLVSRSTSSEESFDMADSSSSASAYSDDRGPSDAAAAAASKTPRPSPGNDQRAQPTPVLDSPPHTAAAQPGRATEKYLTPLQQKERTIRELGARAAKLEQAVRERDARLARAEDDRRAAVEEARYSQDSETAGLHDQIEQLEAKLRQSEASLAERASSMDDQRQSIAELEARIEAMTKEQEDKESVHQKRYLDMYQKGREAQLIDQEEDLVCMAIASAPGGSTQTQRLVRKLEETEKELAKLRQAFRENVYRKSPPLGSDSAAQVEILKSSVFYFLTDIQPEVNLNAMMSMLNYSDVQKRKIVSHLKKKMK